MTHLIDKDSIAAEIERRKKYYENMQKIKPVYESNIEDFNELLSFIDTLEVKEVHECNNVDLNPLFEEMGVEPDSRIVLMLKNAFYKSLDNYLDKKKDEL